MASTQLECSEAFGKELGSTSITKEARERTILGFIILDLVAVCIGC